jgi:hypothetical protein
MRPPDVRAVAKPVASSPKNASSEQASVPATPSPITITRIYESDASGAAEALLVVLRHPPRAA